MEIARAAKVLAASVLPAVVALAPTQIPTAGGNSPSAVSTETPSEPLVVLSGPEDDGGWP